MRDTTRIDLSKSNAMRKENIENIAKSNINFTRTFVDHYLLPDINFNEQCLKNNIYIPKNVTYIHIYYTLNPQFRNKNAEFILGHCLFGSVKLNKC